MILTVTLNPSLDEWLHLPVLRLGVLNRATDFHRYPGGKGINVSRVVRELGGPTVAYAFAGGADGQMLEQLLRRLKVPSRFVPVAGTTRNNYKIRTQRPPVLTEINAVGPRISAAELGRMRRRVLAHDPAPRCVVLSGSLPPGVPLVTYRQWILALRRRRVPVLLDTSGEALRQGLAARPWAIKPNRQEAEELLGRRIRVLDDVERAATDLLARGPQVVILSLGAEGALMACTQRGDSRPALWLARTPAVATDSGVGAGDSLVAGFLTGWVRRRSLPEAFRLGAACGTAAVTTPGTELCHRADVRRLLPHVQLRRVGG